MKTIAKLGSLFGINREKQRSEERLRLLTLFRANREKASRLIPESMKSEFLTSVFPDKALNRAINECFRQGKGDDGYIEFLKLRMYYCISTKDFGLRLINFNIKPDDVAKTMLEGVNPKEK
jgi:hypothetical protein